MKTSHAKKAFFFLALACLAGLAVAFAVVTRTNNVQEEEIAALNTEKQGLSAELESRDETISDFMASFDEIESNLDLIRAKEEKVREYAEGEEVLGNQKDRIVRDIKVINTLMAENKDKIANLEKRLRSSGLKIKGFDEKIAQLKASSAEKDQQIAALKTEVQEKEITIVELNSQLTSQEAQMAMQDGIIEMQEEQLEIQDNEIHQVWFTTGSFKELKDKGIVEKDGALFGVLGGDKKFTGAISHEDFIQVDMRELDEVPIFSKKARLITAHPDHSYEFAKDEKGEISMLEITDPDSFWATSPYLVVAVD